MVANVSDGSVSVIPGRLGHVAKSPGYPNSRSDLSRSEAYQFESTCSNAFGKRGFITECSWLGKGLWERLRRATRMCYGSKGRIEGGRGQAIIDYLWTVLNAPLSATNSAHSKSRFCASPLPISLAPCSPLSSTLRAASLPRRARRGLFSMPATFPGLRGQRRRGAPASATLPKSLTLSKCGPSFKALLQPRRRAARLLGAASWCGLAM